MPAEGHDYSMATSAGLKVTTSNGMQVKVTAVYEGKEYLFADLYVAPGTTELPVTIPKSVTEVIIKTPTGKYTAGVDDTVNLDIPAPGSRGSSWNAGTIYDEYLRYYTDSYMNGPYLVFEPEDLLKDYFTANPIGRDNTDYWRKEDADGVISYSEGFNKQVFWGETAIGDGDIQKGHNHDMSYYIFPIWWRARDGVKDYRFALCQSKSRPDRYNKNDPNGGKENYERSLAYNFTEFWFENGLDYDSATATFSPQYTTDNNPFPFLGYRDTKISAAERDVYDPMTNGGFTFNNTGSFEQAFPLDCQGSVITQGLKITFNNLREHISDGQSTDIQDFANHVFGKNSASLCIFSEGGTNKSISTPNLASFYWSKAYTEESEDKYFDETLDNLFFATVSTKRTMVPEKTFMIRDNTLDINKTINTEGDYAHLYGDQFQAVKRSGSFIIGFNSAPKGKASTATRDYADVLLLVVPVNDDETDFGYIYDEPVEPLIWTVAAEDLGSTDDWDFNDIVIQFTQVLTNLNAVNKNSIATNVDGPQDAATINTITVKPMAAGGIMPLYVIYHSSASPFASSFASSGDIKYSTANDDISGLTTFTDRQYAVGKEIHEWLGGSVSQMINTGAKRQNMNVEEVRFCIPANSSITFKNGSNRPNDGYGVCGFIVVVDKDNEISLDNSSMFREIDLDYTRGTYLLTAPNAEEGKVAPQIMAIAGDWEWPRERITISDAYPDFTNWVTSFTVAMGSDWPTSTVNKANVTAK